MKIVNKVKFIKTIFVLNLIILIFIFFCNKTYSNVETKYKEEYISYGDTLWDIAQKEVENNKYFENKDIREVVSSIKNLNNLNNTNLKEGQKILIPIYK